MNILLNVIIFILLFFLGASVGSFIGAMASRFSPNEDKKSLREKLSKRSYCESCNSELRFIDLIPVFSYLFLNGKCRKCYEKISSALLILESICGFILVVFFLQELLSGNTNFGILIFKIIISYIFIFWGYFDYLYWEVPLKSVIYTALALVSYNVYLLAEGTIQPLDFLQVLSSGLIGILLISYFIWVSSGKGLGWGDAWVFGIIGLISGWKGIVVVFFLSAFFGTFFGLASVVRNRKKLNGTIIQFIPFIALGFVINLLDSNLFIFNVLFPFEPDPLLIGSTLIIMLFFLYIVIKKFKIVRG